MSEVNLLEQVANKKIDKVEMAENVMQNPELIPELFQGLRSKKADIKYGCDKILRLISDQRPELLYSKIDFFIEALGSENNFLKWGAIHILANLTVVDCECKFEKIIDCYFEPIPGPVLVTAANVIKNAAKIVQAKPALTETIVAKILPVEKARYRTDECRNIALGQAIDAFAKFYPQIQNKTAVEKLIKKQLQNTRSSTRKKAEKFVRKFAIS
ncbi:MAG: hypothetical protein ACE5HS_16795 [bacterium]